ncbi:MAG: ribosomal RNA small subunit methyltransferase A [Nitrospirae bacterium]|nr:ribosomal RNA small subunit methyltransferase A [Nitrospirota bacterium]
MRRPLGQHFLFDPRILKKIVDCAGITPKDTVVEIGPGKGIMTRILAERAKKGIELELDRKLAAGLKGVFAGESNVEIIEADAIKFPYETINGTFKVVANIPYYATTPILFRLLEFKKKILSMTLLLQKEVARRIIASPGGKDYGVLSITTQLYTKPKLKFLVSRGSFTPPPKVDSAVVHFEVSNCPLFKICDEMFFLKVVRTAFSQRRKTITNSLKSFDGIKEAVVQANIDPKSRPEVLSIEDFVRLSDTLIQM